MANNLTAIQAAAFKGPTADLSKVVYTATLNVNADPPLPIVEVTDRVNSFGSCRVTAWPAHPSRARDFSFPRMNWELKNPDGFFTPGHANEVWAGDVPQAWQMVYRADEWITSPTAGTNLLFFRFDVIECQLVDEVAILTGIHPLARMLGKRWRRVDRHAADWATNAVSHTMTL